MIINAGIIFGKVLRKFAHTLIKKYYPKIQFTGVDQIPSDGPILFCANHPNSLIDPVLIGITAKRPVSFMAKAPLFRTPILGPIMHALGMVPAYRGRDDSSQVKKNQKSLDRVIQGLQSGRAMGIFPEGVSTDLRQLGLVRGGAARIALGAFEGGVEDLVIIPLGINYERKERLGSKVWINVGEPIQLQSFVDSTRSNEEKGITEDKVLRRKLTQQIESNLKTVIVHLENAEWDPLLDDLETLVEHSKHKASLKIPKLMRRKRIADALNYFHREEETGTEVIAQIKQYHQKVKSAGLLIDDPILQRSTPKTTFRIFWQLIHLVIWFIPALFGTLGNIVPFVITRAIAGKVQDEGQKTTALARIGVGLPIYLLWYGSIAYIVIQETSQFVLVTVTNFLLVLSGTIALKYWPYCIRTMIHLGHQLRISLKRERLKQLRAELIQIRETLVQYAERYAKLVPRPNPPSIKPLLMMLASTISSLMLLSIAFIFYMSLQIYFNTEIENQFEAQPVKTVPVNEETVTQAEKTVIRIGDKARITHLESSKKLDEYLSGTFKFENQDNRRDVSAMLHNFYQARDELLKIYLVFNPDRQPEDSQVKVSRRRLMQLSAAAMLLRHQMSLQFAATYIHEKELTKYLNQQDDTFGIPEGLVRRVNEELNAKVYNEHIATVREQYMQEIEIHGVDESEQSEGLFYLISQANKTINAIHAKNSDPLHSSVRSAISNAVRNGVNSYLKIQRIVATEIGDFRIKNTDEVKNHHIPKEDVEKFHQQLQPGDILIERRDWYSSNAFLPGYWPHGALYVGTPNQWDDDLKNEILVELRKLTKEEESRNQDATLNNGKQHIQKMHQLINNLETGNVSELNNKHIIEAVSEGVIHNTIDHSVGEASSVFALRPLNLKDGEQAEAIARAYYYLGRNYDFDFDFDTPNTLVCTEVIYRCYGGNSDKATLRFPIVTVLGRRTLPAHQLATQFVESVQTGNPQFKLVAWLDHDRINQTATVTTYDDNYENEQFAAFADTLKRSSITFVMEYKKHGMSALVGKPTIFMFYLSLLTACCYAIAKLVFFLRAVSENTDLTLQTHLETSS